ncbi:YtxH domain-containing protein [Desulfofundulus thermobenzoicus]|uniref:YtxH domain-containing protein n=1 Tax=Desulfofundulus thermobenzoicus TaxID=29376 RepID=A0A6N7IQ23_9FIRM|nr:YtxH domain-containing protein [Desulfofundulus thermobenzoicus]HHW44527.1 YtxH domain-containing protein [Desulfotomaculum sp.]
MGFWRGMVAGSVVGALLGMIMGPPQRKPGGKNIFRITRRTGPMSRTRRMLRGVTGRVSEIIRDR